MDESNDPQHRSEEVTDKTAEIKATASEAVDQARRTAKAAWDKAKSRIGDLDSLRVYVREKPVQAAAVMLGIGFIAGLLCRR